jgi:3-methylcrotonyl-CoA carboxylase alpha subunit
VRIDDGVREGDTISPYYDSMIAKLIVHGETRQQALAHLDQALSELHIVGVANNVAFLRQVLCSPSFIQAQLDTALIEREKEVLFHQQPLAVECAVSAAVAQELQSTLTNKVGWQDPWSHTDGWTVQGSSRRAFEFTVEDKTWIASLTQHNHGAMILQVGDATHSLHWQAQDGAVLLQWGPQRLRAHVYTFKDQRYVFADAGSCSLLRINPLAHVAQDAAAGGNLSAPMPGKLLSFMVRVGDKVQAGQALAVMEAMKMEHTVAAPAAGTVAELLYAPGDQVAEGAPLLRLDVQAD